jgi:hypothetical protein
LERRPYGFPALSTLRRGHAQPAVLGRGSGLNACAGTSGARYGHSSALQCLRSRLSRERFALLRGGSLAPQALATVASRGSVALGLLFLGRRLGTLASNASIEQTACGVTPTATSHRTAGRCVLMAARTPRVAAAGRNLPVNDLSRVKPPQAMACQDQDRHEDDERGKSTIACSWN